MLCFFFYFSFFLEGGVDSERRQGPAIANKLKKNISQGHCLKKKYREKEKKKEKKEMNVPERVPSRDAEVWVAVKVSSSQRLESRDWKRRRGARFAKTPKTLIFAFQFLDQTLLQTKGLRKPCKS